MSASHVRACVTLARSLHRMDSGLVAMRTALARKICSWWRSGLIRFSPLQPTSLAHRVCQRPAPCSADAARCVQCTPCAPRVDQRLRGRPRVAWWAAAATTTTTTIMQWAMTAREAETLPYASQAWLASPVSLTGRHLFFLLLDLRDGADRAPCRHQ